MKIRQNLLHSLPLALLLLGGCRHGGGSGLASCLGAQTNDAAIEACTPVIDSKEASAHDRATAYSYRGGARGGKGDAAGAISDLNAAVALAPDDASILANRGAIYTGQNQLGRAIPDLLAAIRMNPNEKLALGNLAIVHEKRGEWDQARVLVDRVLKLDPSVPQMWGERCWIGAVSDADAAAALPDCTHAIELSQDPNNYNSRGMAYYRAGRFAESIADYDRSLQGDPNVGSSYYMRGRAKRAAGLDGAQEDIEKGLSLEPGVAQRYAGYGVAAE